MTLLSISNLIKRYGSYLVIEAEALEMPPGIHLLYGPNGSGKTTFLKVLAGLVPFQGDIMLDEHTNLQKDRMAIASR